jgi:uncharacterized membrane protein required for colicin V production
MNWFDVALAALIVISLVSGIREGFSRSGFGFLAIILAFLAAAWLYPMNLAGFLIVFVSAICASAVIGFLLGRWFRREGQPWLDSILGAAFGVTNALLFSVLAVLAILAFAPKTQREYVARSNFAPYAAQAACTVAEIVPGEMKFRVKQSYQELEHVLPTRFRKALRPATHTGI